MEIMVITAAFVVVVVVAAFHSSTSHLRNRYHHSTSVRWYRKEQLSSFLHFPRSGCVRTTRTAGRSKRFRNGNGFRRNEVRMDDTRDKNCELDDSFVMIPSDLYKHRCYYQPYQNENESITVASTTDYNDNYSVLVICGGMAQTMTQYQSHIKSLSQHRNVLFYQPEGLGLYYTGGSTGNTPPKNISLPYQAKQLRHAIEYYYVQHQKSSSFSVTRNKTTSTPTIIHVDLVGFSLGGRIALAFIIDTLTQQQQQQQPLDSTAVHTTTLRTHKVHLTGVSRRRSPYGIVQGMIWKDHLTATTTTTTTVPNSTNHNDNNNSNNHHQLRPFGWSILTAAYSHNFLYQNQKYLHSWVQSLCYSHTTDGLLHLIEQTYDHENDCTNPWSVNNMIQRISLLLSDLNNNKSHYITTLHFRCMVGEYDVLALPEDVLEMVETFRSNHSSTDIVIVDDDVVVVPNVGHAVPIEASSFWCMDVQSYFFLKNTI